jgi:hypothetical protein
MDGEGLLSRTALWVTTGLMIIIFEIENNSSYTRRIYSLLQSTLRTAHYTSPRVAFKGGFHQATGYGAQIILGSGTPMLDSEVYTRNLARAKGLLRLPRK